MKSIFIEFDGKTHAVPVQKIKGTLWYHWQGQTYSYRPENLNRSRGEIGSLNPGQIVSPMPGKVLKISVQPGQQVSQGDVVVIIEAMKMEYSLAADKGGQISDFSIQVGDQVEKGQVLLTVEGDH